MRDKQAWESCFDEYASRFDLYDRPWLDMGANDHFRDGYLAGIATKNARIAELEEAVRWCKWPEERPEVDKHYQTIGKDGSMGHDYFQTGAWWYYGKKIPDGDITHWRPIDLPEEG